MKRVTVKTIVRIRRSLQRANVMKHASQTVVYSVLPATFNDTVIHHAPLTIKEVASVTTDTLIASALKIALELCLHL